MASLAVLTNGGMDLGLQATGLTEGLDLGSRWREGQSVLSWRDEFLAGTHTITRPEVIVVDKAKIYLKLDILRGIKDGLYVSIETPDPKQMPLLIERTVAYIGGRISTFDLNPTQPNSFIGGVANDVLRLVEIVRRRWHSVVQRIKFSL
jgi:hypothetical protein